MATRIIFLSTLIMAITFFQSCAHRHGANCSHNHEACASCKDATKTGAQDCASCKDMAKAEAHNCTACKDSK